jgi:hypothetical protein
MGIFGVVSTVLAMKHFGPARATLLNLATEDEDRKLALNYIAHLRGTLLINLSVSIATVVILTPLGFALQRPWQAARVLAWVGAAVLVLAVAVSIPGSPIMGTGPGFTAPTAISRAYDNLLPAWYLRAMAVWALVELAALLAFPVLLAWETSSEFYRGPDTGDYRMWHLPSTAG